MRMVRERQPARAPLARPRALRGAVVNAWPGPIVIGRRWETLSCPTKNGDLRFAGNRKHSNCARTRIAF
eukprot:2052579-Pyramimonas_sp.AAC.1